jgi:hypothetical protein
VSGAGFSACPGMPGWKARPIGEGNRGLFPPGSGVSQDGGDKEACEVKSARNKKLRFNAQQCGTCRQTPPSRMVRALGLADMTGAA